MSVVCKPDVILNKEKQQAKTSKPCKEVRISSTETCMKIMSTINPLSKTGVARLFWSRAKFENYFSLRAALFKIGGAEIFFGSFWCSYWQLLTKFLVVEDLYVAFSHNRKRSKGLKNKLEGRMQPAGCTLAMSALI